MLLWNVAARKDVKINNTKVSINNIKLIGIADNSPNANIQRGMPI